MLIKRIPAPCKVANIYTRTRALALFTLQRAVRRARER